MTTELHYINYTTDEPHALRPAPRLPRGLESAGMHAHTCQDALGLDPLHSQRWQIALTRNRMEYITPSQKNPPYYGIYQCNLTQR